ncbi:hypothetical protein M011DRAFT_296951 [Sporormia fimetaria CBS 119925]|uniref:Uncharacterized protein n=1 Tax=Sporormia fimetaria CBS 119925 TaxID=1340428 RepID=A0A6A6UX36_9PLEO|nr:hypothetical protein M011DRAFT_296951 [Sporormia fimetaria CBS 119925]
MQCCIRRSTAPKVRLSAQHSSRQPIFDKLTSSTTAPRICVSQDRTWQAVAGHGVDLKKVPEMQFVLLSIIAAHGPEGIHQPDLVKLSGQDKRSVPKRTDDLARAGYIEKNPVHIPGHSTTALVHRRYVGEGHFLRACDFQDVFRDRSVILSSMIGFLYKIMESNPVLPLRDLREKLGVTRQEWSTRGIRSAVRRLEATGMLERRRALRWGSRKNTTTVLKLMRPPNDDDLKGLFGRYKHSRGESPSVSREDSEEPDDLMQDLEQGLELVPEDDDEDERLENERVPPQWSPDRLLSNVIFETVERAGMGGTDTSKLRDLTMGKFWKRPSEALVSRLAEDWEESQPLHLRHLALIRDTTVTNEKKLLHFIYRSYTTYQEAVNARQAEWDVVYKGTGPHPGARPKLDQWGFPDHDPNEFHLDAGSSSLAECHAAVKPAHKKLKKWEDTLTGLGYRKKGRPRGVKDVAGATRLSDERSAETPAVSTTSDPSTTPAKRKQQLAVPLLSADQRRALGLPARGRLGLDIENQIREHRLKTGDPTSLPDTICREPGYRSRQKHVSLNPQPQEAPEASIETQDSQTSLVATKRKASDDEQPAADPKRLRVASEAHTPSSRGVGSVHVTPGVGTVTERKQHQSQRLPQDALEPRMPSRVSDPRVKAALDSFTQRSAPGLYLNPYATRPVPRGRPRKAFIAVVKSPRLQEFEWFRSTPSRTAPALTAIPQPRRAIRKPETSPASVVEPTTDERQTPQASSTSGLDPAIDNNNGDFVHDRTPPVPSSASPSKQCNGKLAQVLAADMSERPPSRTSWNPINTPQKRHSNMSEPPSVRPILSQIQQRIESHVNGLSSRTDFPSSQPTNLDVRTGTTDSMGSGSELGAVAESRAPLSASAKNNNNNFGRTPTLTRRGTARKGNVWRMRRTVILDILDRCDGVFPFNGEIVVPFFKIWDERVGKSMSRPDRTTISNMVNAMLEEPDSEIKKIAFRIPSVDRRSTVERYLVARQSIEPTDPIITDLQSNMAKVYPRKYYPSGIRHLAGPDMRKAVVPDAPFDPTITVEGDTPHASQKLQQRILAAAANRRRRADIRSSREQQTRETLLKQQKDSVDGGVRQRLESLGTLGGRSTKPHRAVHGIGKFIARRKNDTDGTAPDSEVTMDEEYEATVNESDMLRLILLQPCVHFHASSGTFSTHFGIHEAAQGCDGGRRGKKRKRVRFADGAVAHNKRLRLATTSRSRRSQKHMEQPTVLQRLSGLTGDPNEPVYVAPVKKRYRTAKPWKPLERQSTTRKAPQARTTVRPLDAAERFKKSFCTLAIASCMSGGDAIDWTIVAKVYASDHDFHLDKAKKLWSWMQVNMDGQTRLFIEGFQTSFLEAYEQGRVQSIEDPKTHDWGALVRWALKNCDYPDAPLPCNHVELQLFEVEESQYNAFSRTEWAQTANLAHKVRMKRLLEYSYALPLRSKPTGPPVDDALRARSWIRSNTATPQEVFDGKQAHDKLRTLGDDILERTINDLLAAKIIRQRKIKRLLPGRNYDFLASLARKYRRTLEMHVFTEAVEMKKRLDKAFIDPRSDRRYFVLSRTAKDGAVMALFSLLAEGQIKITPILPPINNDPQAPAPRLSVWGLMETGYKHRKIDRKRIFWEIRAEPTQYYTFGNPLRPCPATPAPGSYATWLPLADPPLPGKEDPRAPLPIWSSIDGQHVTWPWWYRLLNLVLQIVAFQPGASAAEVYEQCPSESTELFEVELVLKWLASVNAAEELEDGTWTVKAGFWAAFGDQLVDEGQDWFGEHVKRVKPSEVKQPERFQYNIRSARVSAMVGGEGGGEPCAETAFEVTDGGNGVDFLERMARNFDRLGAAVANLSDDDQHATDADRLMKQSEEDAQMAEDAAARNGSRLRMSK